MAKGQQRSNREVKKPKAKKPAAPVAGQTFLNKSAQKPIGGEKKKP